MTYSVKVKARSSKNEVISKDASTLVVYTTKSPVDNEANEAVRELLAEKFKVAKTRIVILKGKKSKNKLVQIK